MFDIEIADKELLGQIEQAMQSTENAVLHLARLVSEAHGRGLVLPLKVERCKAFLLAVHAGRAHPKLWSYPRDMRARIEALPTPEQEKLLDAGAVDVAITKNGEPTFARLPLAGLGPLSAQVFNPDGGLRTIEEQRVYLLAHQSAPRAKEREEELEALKSLTKTADAKFIIVEGQSGTRIRIPRKNWTDLI